MTIEEAKSILLNTAWLGTNKDREKTEEAVRVLIAKIEQESHNQTKVDLLTDINKKYRDALEMLMKALEPKTEWIPVSERLPESQVEVIVSCTDDSGDAKFRHTSSGWITTDKKYWIVDNEINCFVTAWMPLPEPYKEG